MKIKKFFVFIIVAAITIAGAVTVTAYKTNSNLSVLLYTKVGSFEKEWKRVDSLSNKGLNKSALDVVNGIYAKAKADNNAAQFVKAIIHRMKFEQMMEEFSTEKALAALSKETAEAKYPIKPILQSMLAQTYWNYYEQNRWVFYNRTTTVNFEKEDVATWDLKTLLATVINNYRASIENKDSLQRTPINLYDEVLVKQPNSRLFRPSLYDFLAHRAVDFFMNEEPDITQVNYKFELSDAAYFAPANEFVKMKLVSNDTFSLKFFALQTLQSLLQFHCNPSFSPILMKVEDARKADALVDVDLKRLAFVRNKSTVENKDSIYFNALTNLSLANNKVPAKAEVLYAMANFIYEKGNLYNGKNGAEFQDKKKDAYVICNNVIATFPNSNAAKNCAVLKANIESKELSFIVERAVLPMRPSLSKITYKNVKKVYVRIAEVDIDKYNKTIQRLYGNNLINAYLKLKPTKEFELELPDDGDFQQHSTEFIIPEMGFGHYIVLIGSDKNFSYKKNAVAYNALWSSNLSYLNRRMDDGSVDFYLQQRFEGEPIQGVTAQLYYEQYDYITRNYKYVKGEKYTSDENGYFNVPPSGDYRNFSIDFSYKTIVGPITINDRLQTDNAIYQYRNYSEERQSYLRSFFFTDRAIYRPGQTIYFKGILINTNGENNSIAAKTKTTVTFYDANYQKISDVNLVSNEYGTVSGSFAAPMGVLNGQMTIGDGNGTAYISVEEYKRPKFEVTFQPVEGSYKLNQNIKVNGVAKAYSGARIDGAAVKYRIVRNASFPAWYYWWRSFSPASSEMEIASGSLVSNDTGAFFVDFTAIPDKAIAKKDDPSYTYTIYADVTDINGETHSATTYVNVGYTALNLSVNIPAILDNESKYTIALNTNNRSGQFEAAKGNITIYKLIEPAKTYRDRAWTRPDKYIINKNDFERNFPEDEYTDENNRYKWERGEKVFDKSFNNTSTLVPLKTGKSTMVYTYDSLRITNLKTWKQGAYLVEAITKDAYGETVKDIRYIDVYNNSGTEAPNLALYYNTEQKYTYEPGEKHRFTIGSSLNNVKVLYEIEHKGKVIKRSFIALNKEQKQLELPIEEKYRGNVSYHLVFVKNNRTYSKDATVYVPYTNKELDISFETFRDKLQPGQEEEWRLKLKDRKGEKMAAEMMVTLYDASLDAFRPNSWYFALNNSYYSSLYWDAQKAFGTSVSQAFANEWNKYPQGAFQRYDQLNWFGYNAYNYRNYNGAYLEEVTTSSPRGARSNGITTLADAVPAVEEKTVFRGTTGSTTKGNAKKESAGWADGDSNNLEGAKAEDKSAKAGEKNNKDQSVVGGANLSGITARNNFAETAFFFPQLQTDKDGSIIIKFKMPESLTKWKMMGLAHTKDLKLGQIQKELVTQKELMVVPNAPRLFRENDKIELSAKITNLSDKAMSGSAQLVLFDATTMKPLTSVIVNTKSNDVVQTFSNASGQSTSLSWWLQIPESVGAITYKIVAKAGNFSDGEEMAIPVLSNRMLVTESLPIWVKAGQNKTYSFDKLKNQNNNSSTLRNHKLTLEFTSNPAWYAVQALPYLMEYPYECAEQTFARYYANTLASSIAVSSPKIKAVFDAWKNAPKGEALLSNLEKNQELKALLLEETPWVLQGKDETERKKRIALLFDLNRMGNELNVALKKLQKMQTPNGGFPWYEGMPDDRYITQHIVTGIGHLDHLNIKNAQNVPALKSMLSAAIQYLDKRIREDYEWILKYDKPNVDKNHIGYLQIQYLYARSYFTNEAIASNNQAAFNYYKGQAKKYWLSQSRYMQGMVALALHRYEDKTTPKDILKSLKENAIVSEELGMYWKDINGGYYWYEAPVESQALLIEAFDEVTNNKNAVNDMRLWLLRSKQTQDWKSTKATSEAVYALLLRGSDWLTTDNDVNITVGSEDVLKAGVSPNGLDGSTAAEAGTGYFKKVWNDNSVKASMGTIALNKTPSTNGSGAVSWGAMYWQYFEQLDKITSAKTPLSLKKQLFLQQNSERGPVITPINANTTLKVGDKIKVRIELRSDRDMEYVQMKDMRASGLEPTNVFSSYRYQGGLGYYQSTRDAATNFFFAYLPKGTYVFEYDLVAAQNGDFSNGITSIQCMYAPEFASNSEGVRLKIGK